MIRGKTKRLDKQLGGKGVQILIKNTLIYQNHEVGIKVRISDNSIGVSNILMTMETLKLTHQSKEVSIALGYEDEASYVHVRMLKL